LSLVVAVACPDNVLTGKCQFFPIDKMTGDIFETFNRLNGKFSSDILIHQKKLTHS